MFRAAGVVVWEHSWMGVDWRYGISESDRGPAMRLAHYSFRAWRADDGSCLLACHAHAGTGLGPVFLLFLPRLAKTSTRLVLSVCVSQVGSFSPADRTGSGMRRSRMTESRRVGCLTPWQRPAGGLSGRLWDAEEAQGYCSQKLHGPSGLSLDQG